MALTVEALVDKSALARITHRAVRAVLEPLLVDGRLATCAATDLEMLFRARNGAEWIGPGAGSARCASNSRQWLWNWVPPS